VVIRKIQRFIASNDQVIEAAEQYAPNQVGEPREENELLSSYLPNFWDKTEISSALHSDPTTWFEVIDATNHGKAVGIAMRWLRKVQAPVEGATVAEAILDIRKGG